MRELIATFGTKFEHSLEVEKGGWALVWRGGRLRIMFQSLGVGVWTSMGTWMVNYGILKSMKQLPGFHFFDVVFFSFFSFLIANFFFFPFLDVSKPVALSTKSPSIYYSLFHHKNSSKNTTGFLHTYICGLYFHKEQPLFSPEISMINKCSIMQVTLW